MTTVAAAVAVNGGRNVGGKGSILAVTWAVKNLYPKADRFFLVHIMPLITSIISPNGGTIPLEIFDQNDVALFTNDQIAKRKEELVARYSKVYQCMKAAAAIEICVILDDDPASALLRFASQERISDLVLGSCSLGILDRKIKETSVPKKVLDSLDLTCNVFVIGKQKVSKRGANAVGRGVSVEPESKGLRCNYSERWRDEASDVDSEEVRSAVSSGRGTCSTSESTAGQIEQLRMEWKTTISMYNRTCEGLAHTLNKVQLLSSECLERTKDLNAAIEREQRLRRIAAEENEGFLQAKKEADEAKVLLAKQSTERAIAENNAARESREIKKLSEMLITSDTRYRRYTMEELRFATDNFSAKNLIGEGSYGKVYRCLLHHTPVAVKVLQTDAIVKKVEFFKEIEVLSHSRHPHLVLLVGACPENGCLIYEYLENGSLDEWIFGKKGKTPLPWFVRFRIIFEIACGLSFLHNSKPDPIVHRDVKPGNILLDKNYVSKIGDVGLAKFIYNQVPDNVTEYRDSLLAGSFHYMDPEYHRTGVIRPKSDLYAFGIIILQLLTGHGPTHLQVTVENAIENATLHRVLDSSVRDWPLSESIELARIGLMCSNLRCRDRPDLDEVVPVLKRIADSGDAVKLERRDLIPPSFYFCPILQVVMENPCIAADGFSYERVAIEAWLKNQEVSPVTKMKLQHKRITANFSLRSAIEEWKSRSNFRNV